MHIVREIIVNQNDVIAGLDIGTTKICCVAAEVGENNDVRIIGMGTCASHGIISGVVVDIDSTVEAIRTAVSLASQQSGKEITSVYAGVTGKHISSVNSRGVIAITHPSREITEEDVDRVTDASRLIVIPPDQMILSAIPRSFSIDGQSGIKHPLGMSGSRLEVETHIITASRTFIDNIGKCIQKAGLYIDEMILQPLATAESVLLPGEKNLGVCILDIGGGTSDMAIFVQGEIYYSAVIPIAGQHVTYDMAYGLQVNEDEAEKIKLKYGCITPQFILDDETVPVLQIGKGAPRQLPRKTLCVIIEPRMEELFEMALKEIEKSGTKGKLPGGIILSGGGSLMPGTLECAMRVLGMRARQGKPEHVSGLVDFVNSPIYATAVGLVQYGIKQKTQEPPSRHSRGLLDSISKFFSGILSRLGFG